MRSGQIKRGPARSSEIRRDQAKTRSGKIRRRRDQAKARSGEGEIRRDQAKARSGAIRRGSAKLSQSSFTPNDQETGRSRSSRQAQQAASRTVPATRAKSILSILSCIFTPKTCMQLGRGFLLRAHRAPTGFLTLVSRTLLQALAMLGNAPFKRHASSPNSCKAHFQKTNL